MVFDRRRIHGSIEVCWWLDYVVLGEGWPSGVFLDWSHASNIADMSGVVCVEFADGSSGAGDSMT